MSDATINPIPGCHGYFAGSDGTIWSSMPGRGGRYKALHALRLHRDKDGYLNVTLSVGPRGRRRYRVQRLVAVAFLGLCPDGMVTRHRNGNQLDNSAENLIYGTQPENIADRGTHGTTARGSRQHLAKLTDEHVQQIRNRIQAGESQTALAMEFGVSECSVSDIKKGRTWRHLAAAS